jgi:hypothetical protein
MIIERTENEILIHIPSTANNESAQQIIDCIKYKELTSKSEAN